MSKTLRIATLASLVLSLLAPAAATNAAITLLPGDLIKAPSIDTVYYFGQDGKRYVFPNLKTYLTWYTNFSTLKIVPLADLQNIPLSGNVTYRPGVRMVKITTDPKVYAVSAHGTLRWVMTEQIANQLYGNDWNTKIDDVPDAFFVNYAVGTPISSASQYSPSGEMSSASSISIDKNLAINGNPIVNLTTNLNTVAPNGTVQLTANAVFQGSGMFQSARILNNGTIVQSCSSLPCTVTSPALPAGSNNAFTASVTDTNGMTGTSSPVTVTVSAQ